MGKQEAELVQKAQLGDVPAFEELVRLHDSHVLQIALGMVNNIDDARDIYQETFTKAYTHLSSFQYRSSFKTWITKIAVNASLNYRRKKWFRSRLSLEESEMPIKVEKSNPDRSFFNKELGEAINRSLLKLSRKQRAVFTLKHLHGYKIREIAEMLNCSESTIKSDLYRAIEKLQQQLKHYYSV
ncbi:RNA polymerase sigma factor [candidate division KSB1 bacterium]|nr:RNA polymerase sigma factor [candidate division KSB1 bacterium]